MRFKLLPDWLNWISSVHVKEMDLSLERVAKVATALNWVKPPRTLITVGGTNGKGSCVAGLEAIYRAAGFRVGAFTSPILIKHNEYARVDGINASDEQFCEAFERIDQARGEITLTPFEFTALAAFDIFQAADLDVWILEVGLGGRYDAVNIWDADVAIVASIDIDHVDWLGDTREKIAYEKAGIFRKNKPAVCGDLNPPITLVDYAQEIGTPLYCQNKSFGFEKSDSKWSWWSEHSRLDNLPLPSLALPNMATVLKTIELLQEKLPVTFEAIQQGLSTVKLMGRIQVVPGPISQVVDVSHNPAAALWLHNWLQENPIPGKTRAVFSMLGDKDILATLLVMKDCIDIWHIASLPIPRGATLQKLNDSFASASIKTVNCYASIEEAYEMALQNSTPTDRVVIFGSFHTVALCMQNRLAQRA